MLHGEVRNGVARTPKALGRDEHRINDVDDAVTALDVGLHNGRVVNLDRALRIDLDHRYVRGRVGPHHLGLEGPAIAQHDLHLIGIRHDVNIDGGAGRQTLMISDEAASEVMSAWS